MQPSSFLQSQITLEFSSSFCKDVSTRLDLQKSRRLFGRLNQMTINLWQTSFCRRVAKLHLEGLGTSLGQEPLTMLQKVSVTFLSLPPNVWEHCFSDDSPTYQSTSQSCPLRVKCFRQLSQSLPCRPAATSPKQLSKILS